MSRRNTSAPHELLVISLLLVLVGSALYLTRWAWVPYVFLLGAVGLVGYSFLSTSPHADTRRRRLARMGFLGALLYLVAFGFMLDGSTLWILCFAVGTVFTIYHLLTLDH